MIPSPIFMKWLSMIIDGRGDGIIHCQRISKENMHRFFGLIEEML